MKKTEIKQSEKDKSHAKADRPDAGLPESVFSYIKSKIGNIWEELGIEFVGMYTFYGHLKYFYSHLV
jgi:hypothetical protein